MEQYGLIPEKIGMKEIGLRVKTVRWNLSQAELVEESIKRQEAHLAATGALTVQTGQFTGRSPKDRFIVKDALTENTVWWGNINQAISEQHFET